MGLRFRKSINFGGARINISKKGVGWSIGGKGARYTKTADGKTRTTLSIPNTGLSYVTEQSNKAANKTATTTSKPTPTSNEILKICSRNLGIITAATSALLLFASVPVGVTGIAIGAGLCFLSKLISTKK